MDPRMRVVTIIDHSQLKRRPDTEEGNENVILSTGWPHDMAHNGQDPTPL
jgi:hypothetical protein